MPGLLGKCRKTAFTTFVALAPPCHSWKQNWLIHHADSPHQTGAELARDSGFLLFINTVAKTNESIGLEFTNAAIPTCLPEPKDPCRTGYRAEILRRDCSHRCKRFSPSQVAFSV